MGFGLRFNLLVLAIAILSTPVLSDLIISKVDRRVSSFLSFVLSLQLLQGGVPFLLSLPFANLFRPN